MKKISRQNLMVIIALFIVFVFPMIIAFYMFNNDIRFTNKTTNHGELLKPMLAIDSLQLVNSSKQKITRNTLHRTWGLIYFSNQSCTELCQQNLYKMQQVRLALGAKQNKLQCFIATPNSFRDPKLEEVLKNNYPTIQNIIVTKENPNIQFQSLYLVDPMGNIMMRYDENAEPKGILKDLKRLIHE